MKGLLFSQIGYEAREPVRVVLRSDQRSFLSQGATAHTGGTDCECSYWGTIWGEHWWVAEFPAPRRIFESPIEIRDEGRVVMTAEGLRVADGILWAETAALASYHMLERRARLAKAGCGWQDAGSLWQESNSHSSMILGLLDLVERAAARFDEAAFSRICAQVVNGCDYLLQTQRRAAADGHPDGSLVHDDLAPVSVVLPNDALKAVVAWRKAARLLPESYREKRAAYAEAADRASRWLTTQARPMADVGFTRRQRGLPESFAVPADEWMTRDLVFFLWGALEAARVGNPSAALACRDYARKIAARQILEFEHEAGFYGHFREFNSCPHSEKSWVHSIADNLFGSDAGGSYPNYLMPLVEMLAIWPTDPEASMWREVLRRFGYGFLLPACERNPFLIVPQGVFGAEGPLWFAGLWHGMNAAYGLTAALAFELEGLFEDPRFRRVGYGNLQWLAGLHAGVTRESLFGCHISSLQIPDGEAWPGSMICGVGNRWVGTWLNTRGVICNGFSTGHQFQFDVDPVRANDGPSSFTDEDWIPHSAGWLSGLVRL